MPVNEMVRTTTITMIQAPGAEPMVSKVMVVRLFAFGMPDIQRAPDQRISPEFVTIQLSSDGLTDKVTVSGPVITPKGRGSMLTAERTWTGQENAPDWLRDVVADIKKGLIW